MVTRYEGDNGATVVERQPDSAVLWFKAEAVHADAHFSWWAAFLAVAVPVIGVAVAFALLNGREEDLRDAVRSGRNGVPVVRRFTVGDAPAPIISTTMQAFECHDDEVLARTTFTHTSLHPGSISGPGSIEVDEAIARPPTYHFTLPYPTFADLRTVALWTVRNAETQGARQHESRCGRRDGRQPEPAELAVGG